MSELKDYDIMDIEAMDDERLEKSESGRIQVTRVYIKAEADKVIAEKDKEIQRLENLCESYRIDCDNLAITTDRMRRVGRTLREGLTHQKYKRCLAMAYWCSAELGMLVSTWESKIKHYKRWQKRWLELAEKFKEAK